MFFDFAEPSGEHAVLACRRVRFAFEQCEPFRRAGDLSIQRIEAFAYLERFGLEHAELRACVLMLAPNDAERIGCLTHLFVDAPELVARVSDLLARTTGDDVRTEAVALRRHDDDARVRAA